MRHSIHSRIQFKTKLIYILSSAGNFSPVSFAIPFFSLTNFVGLFSFQLLTFVCRTPNNNTPCFKNSCHILYKYNRLFWRKYNIHPPQKKIHRCKNTIFRQLGSCVLPSVGWRDIQLLIIKEGGSTLGYRPLGCIFAKTGGAVNGGRSPFTCR